MGTSSNNNSIVEAREAAAAAAREEAKATIEAAVREAEALAKEEALAKAEARIEERHNQRIMDQFVSREVHYCVSQMVNELANNPSFCEDEDLRGILGGLDYREALEEDSEGFVEFEGQAYFVPEDSREAFVALTSFPGCLPESEPMRFASASGAWESLFELWESGIEDEPEDEAEEDREAREEEEREVREEFEEAIASKEEGTVYAMGLAYSVHSTSLSDLIDEIDEDEFLGLFDEAREIDNEDEAREACEEEGIEPREREASEFHIVDDRLASQLKERGELVGEFLGLTIWGRTCSGQSIGMDWVIRDIAYSMGILRGMPYDWSASEDRKKEEAKKNAQAIATLRVIAKGDSNTPPCVGHAGRIAHEFFSQFGEE